MKLVMKPVKVYEKKDFEKLNSEKLEKDLPIRVGIFREWLYNGQGAEVKEEEIESFCKEYEEVDENTLKETIDSYGAKEVGEWIKEVIKPYIQRENYFDNNYFYLEDLYIYEFLGKGFKVRENGDIGVYEDGEAVEEFIKHFVKGREEKYDEKGRKVLEKTYYIDKIKVDNEWNIKSVHIVINSKEYMYKEIGEIRASEILSKFKEEKYSSSYCINKRGEIVGFTVKDNGASRYNDEIEEALKRVDISKFWCTYIEKKNGRVIQAGVVMPECIEERIKPSFYDLVERNNDTEWSSFDDPYDLGEN